MLGIGGKQEQVSRVGLTAADLAGARRREPAAVTRIYTAYAPALFRFFLAAVGDRPTAEDLSGDVFKSAIEDLPRFRGPVEALGGWLAVPHRPPRPVRLPPPAGPQPGPALG